MLNLYVSVYDTKDGFPVEAGMKLCRFRDLGTKQQALDACKEEVLNHIEQRRGTFWDSMEETIANAIDEMATNDILTTHCLGNPELNKVVIITMKVGDACNIGHKTKGY